jgi:alkaline phosphatase
MNFKAVILGLSLLLTAACSPSPDTKTEKVVPKNVILLISDGTGLTQISSAFYFKEGTPNYQRFKQIGLIKTSSSREKVTDSAASGTAFASGIKTYNGAIGVADDSTEVETIIEIAARKGVKSGVIATSSITHATPASFFAHALRRGYEEEIALDLSLSAVEFFAGGGINFFNKREDGRNLLNELIEKNFSLDTTALGDYPSIAAKEKVGYLLAGGALEPIAKGRGNFLPDATELAIQYLNPNEEGFFIMAEGSQIDWGGHDNDADYLVSELIDFDETIGRALDFAEKDGNTLVIVTSDHETGGFTLASKTRQRANGSEYSDYKEIGMKFSTGGHSATLIPVFAYGPGAEEFSGIYENTEIFHKILALTGWNK